MFYYFYINTPQVLPELHPRSLSHPGGYWIMMIQLGPPHVTLLHSYYEYWITAFPEPTSLFILVFLNIYLILINLLMWCQFIFIIFFLYLYFYTLMFSPSLPPSQYTEATSMPRPLFCHTLWPSTTLITHT